MPKWKLHLFTFLVWPGIAYQTLIAKIFGIKFKIHLGTPLECAEASVDDLKEHNEEIK